MNRWVIIGTPGDRRVESFQAALIRCEQKPAQVIPWLAVCNNIAALSDIQKNNFVRIESPGADAAAWSAFATIGGRKESAPPSGTWRPGQNWFFGLSKILAAVDNELQRLGAIALHNGDDANTMTDKYKCRKKLVAHNIPIPLGDLAPTSPALLREMLQEKRWSQVFIKPRWGSSGAGVLAWRRSAFTKDAKELITTTLRAEADSSATTWTNSKRLQTYRDRHLIDQLLAGILADGAIYEQWIPKYAVDEGPLDFRLVVIDGKVCQRIARVGSGPITNLHLDGKRLDVDAALEKLPKNTWANIEKVAQQTAACFPKSVMIGLDCLITDRGSPYILEANAWGDYLPKLLHEGMDTYESQIRAVLNRYTVAAL